MRQGTLKINAMTHLIQRIKHESKRYFGEKLTSAGVHVMRLERGTILAVALLLLLACC